MTNPLDKLARRLEDDPFFLACPLHLFALSENLTEDGLSAALGCSKETLVSLRLCRSPKPDPKAFQKDIDQISARFGVGSEQMAEAVRRGQAIWRMRNGSQCVAGTLLAARDADPSPGGDT